MTSFFSFVRAWRVSLLIMILAAAAFAKKPDRDEKHAGHFFAKMEKELGLTPEQSARIKAVLARDSALSPYGAHPLRGKGGRDGKGGKGCEGCAACARAAHGRDGMGPWGPFSQQLRSAAVDTAALNAGFEEHLAEKRADHARRIAMFAEIHAILTPGQRLQAAEMLDKHRAQMEKRCAQKCGKTCAP
jgi:Spy/CpxP family protein refolding chaperone